MKNGEVSGVARVAVAGSIVAWLAMSGSALGQAGGVDGRPIRNAPLSASAPDPAIVYPQTARGDVVDEYHGTRVADPYRWLEEYTPETRAWIEAQNAITFAYLRGIPQRDAIQRRLTRLWNYERFSIPFKEGGRYFFSRNDGLQNQSVLLTSSSLDGPARVLLDPNTFSKDGTVALAGIQPSKCGTYLAYGTSDAGSDWTTWRVIEIETGRQVGGELRWIKFGGPSWTADSTGFFYSRYDAPEQGEKLKAVNENQKIFFHRLGTEQSQDVLVYARPDKPKWYLFGGVSDDGRYLVISASGPESINNALFYKDLGEPDAPVVELLNQFDARYGFVDNDGPVFFLRTNKDAPKGRVVAIDVREAAGGVLTNPREVIPEQKEAIQGVNLVGGQLMATYLRDAQSLVRRFSPEGKALGELELPGIGSAGGFGGKRTDTETFYSFTNFATPATIYRYDIATGTSTVFRRPSVDFNPADFVTEQVFVTSKDGTRVPMFISHRKGLSRNGDNPVLLYGYGGFNISLTPSFSPTTVQWMEMGGVYALANIRGGGEYGTEWHKAGTQLNKQNVFDDFIASAEWLIDNGYTRPGRLAIQGGSNGGLLVGAAITQRPDLFGAALPAVGVMDMLRFHRFTVGQGWIPDYGSSDDPAQFAKLLSYSPLHNLRPGVCYPPTLITTGDHDDRVHPAHSFKFAAAMQAAQSCANPVLIRIETRAGHGAGKPTWMRIEEAADTWAFLVKTLGMEPTIREGDDPPSAGR